MAEVVVMMRTVFEIKHIGFMKMDVDGHEMAVFERIGKYLNSDFVDYI